MSLKEWVILVDKDNNAIGKEEKIKAHEEGLLHRAFSIIIYRIQERKLEILMQKRSQYKYHSPSQWSITCCSHPRLGESIEDASSRRLKEELGLTVPCKEIGSFLYHAPVGRGLVEHEWDHVLIGQWTGETLSLCPLEVEETWWMSWKEWEKAYYDSPSSFTSWCEKVLSFTQKNFFETLLQKEDLLL